MVRESKFNLNNTVTKNTNSVAESLRIFPPAFFSNKICTEAIDLKNKNGNILHVPKGTTIVLPFHAIMNDKQYYSDSFEPERFLQENGGLKRYKEMGVYYGFSDGPRICLGKIFSLFFSFLINILFYFNLSGMRFALTQLKAAIVEIMRNFEVHVNPKTRSDNTFDPKYFLARLEGGIWLDFKKLN